MADEAIRTLAEFADVMRTHQPYRVTVECADEMARQIDALLAATKWQPIETAPKDGTFVLICGGEPDDEDWNRNVAPCVVARWTGSFWDYGHYAHDDGELEWKRPTHWMPLPSPPFSAA